MPCGDCSTDDLCRCGTDEVCGHCFETARAMGRVLILPEEPEGSERSSTERFSLSTSCECGHSLNWHMRGTGKRNCTVTVCPCSGFLTPEHPKSEDCAHGGARVVGRNDAPENWTRYVCGDCGAGWTRNWSRGGKKTEGAPEPTKGDFLRCQCTHYQMNHRPFTKGGCQNCACDCFRLLSEGHDFVAPEHCDECAKAWRVQLAGGPMVQRPLAPEAPKPCTCGPDEACGDCPNPPGAHDFVSPAHCGACMASWAGGAVPVEDEPRCEGCGHTDAEGCGCPPRCTCGCPKGAHMGKPQGCIPHGFHEYEVPEEPPLTPEEEEQAPEDRCTCGETACESESCDCDSVPCPVDHVEEAVAKFEQGVLDGKIGGPVEPPPPQPVRRPPYAVAYSVQGHLYEVALPGDAAVQAIDGALIITHRLGPVAGICQIAPIVNEESA